MICMYFAEGRYSIFIKLVLCKLKIKRLKENIFKWKLQEASKKKDSITNKNLRHFAFSRVFFRSESKYKTHEISETEHFVTLANG